MITLVIGASSNVERYSYKAVNLLKQYGFPVIALGNKEGKIKDVEINTGRPNFDNIHTVTLYVGVDKQAEYFDYILGLKPQRIIFNPGTENQEFIQLAKSHNIETVVDCTLVMLNTGIF